MIRVPDTPLGRAFGDTFAQIAEHGGQVRMGGSGPAPKASDEGDEAMMRTLEAHDVDAGEAVDLVTVLVNSAMEAAATPQELANAIGGAMLMLLAAGVRHERDRRDG